MYILIDEYHNLVNTALGDTEDDFETLNLKTVESSRTKDRVCQLNLFINFFTTIKDKLSDGGVGKVFITGVIPINMVPDWTGGFDISDHITHDERFEGMCGIFESEINTALDKMIPNDLDLKKKLLKTLNDNYSGYMFSPTQSSPIFNTMIIVYFLKEFQRLEVMPHSLDDPNSQPSESGLEVITTSPLAQKLIDELYVNENGVYVEEWIRERIMIRDMTKHLQTNSIYILSFLYYLGALTQTILPNEKETGTVFKIPNQVIRTQFIDMIKRRLLINHEIQNELIESVNILVESRDIQPLCDVLQQVLSRLRGKNLYHSLENGLKSVFLHGVYLSGRKIQMNVSLTKDRWDLQMKQERWGDFVIENDRIHIEYETIKVDQVQFADGRWFNPQESNWNEGIAISRKIEELNDDELFNLKLKDPIYSILNENRLIFSTIGEVWENALKQAHYNHQFLSQKLGAKVVSFYVLRIGLYRLKCVKIQE